MNQYFVLDIGGTYIKYALMDESGAFLERGKHPSDTDSREGLFRSLAAAADRFEGQYAGIAVSMPGRISTDRGIAHTGGAFKFILDEPVGQELEDIFHVPVTIANDAKCATNAEAWTGALSGAENGVVLVFGTGIGGGIVLNRKVYMGASGASGEVSWLLTDMNRAYEHIEFFEAEPRTWVECASSRALARSYAAKKGLPSADCAQLFEACNAGDREAAQLLDDFVHHVAAGIFSIQSVLDVRRYAIGGGISAQPAVTEGIRRAMDELWESVLRIPFTKPEIVACRYGNDANLIGALRFHLDYTGTK